MKNIIIVAALAVASTGAFANHTALDANEYYQSPLRDHSPGAKADKLSQVHSHGNNTIMDFIEHEHDLPIVGSTAQGEKLALHDHGNNTLLNFVEHKEE